MPARSRSELSQGSEMGADRPRRISDHLWEVPIGFVDGMKVPAHVFASDSIMTKALDDKAVQQIANVATLPGVVGAVAMPDIHWGYGFPIGGVAATEGTTGAISPGGVGFDIGCGVRLLRSDLTWEQVRPQIRELVRALGDQTPKGVGGKGRMPLSGKDLEGVMVEGARFVAAKGVGRDTDVELCEDEGAIPDAEPAHVSDRARQRGGQQLGSLGSGNHFLELQVIDEVRDDEAAKVMGVEEGMVCLMIHSGSRGIGHQVCTDHVRTFDRQMAGLGIEVPDRQLACLPLDHPDAIAYLSAMNAAGNFARANRHILADGARSAFDDVFGSGDHLELVYDVSHNLAKMEDHLIAGVEQRVCVHRKGATRAFGPHHPELPAAYREIGQPVLVPGSMGTASFLLVGTDHAPATAFASTCHGAGRAMSRTQAKKRMPGHELRKQLADQGIVISAGKTSLLSEEAPYAYKDVSEVVETCERASLTRIVARLRPVGVIKG